MVSLKAMRSRPSRTSRSRPSRTSRARSAPARINLNKTEIQKMTPGEARQVLRTTRLSAFARMGRRGLVLVALLLLTAMTSTQALPVGYVNLGQPAPKPATPRTVGRRVSNWMKPPSATEKARRAAEIAASVAAAGLGGPVGAGVTGILLLRYDYLLQFYIAVAGVVYIIYKMKMKDKEIQLARETTAAQRHRNETMERMFMAGIQRGATQIAQGADPPVAVAIPAAVTAGPPMLTLPAPVTANARKVKAVANATVRKLNRVRVPTNEELLARLR
jgi:hypothetical protein